ncbi:hypothetical protein C8F04DRAFT_1268769 [Mycena alexandri]|uniref:3-hydroxyacyl-CoA dehydrogenase C-terminal domain-containing protein n=1 Tax=Mycena alexandri TaxID=1745969 RepID=A0AAD6WYP3_9AGAR|nr:hypothetical protein C8F04DRAFT_1268769 [Mycena alexandri]
MPYLPHSLHLHSRSSPSPSRLRTLSPDAPSPPMYPSSLPRTHQLPPTHSSSPAHLPLPSPPHHTHSPFLSRLSLPHSLLILHFPPFFPSLPPSPTHSIGLDTCLAIQQTLYDGTRDSKYRPCVLLERMVDARWLGRKSGRGFYVYDEK